MALSLTTQARYALRLMLEIAKVTPQNQQVNLNRIAQKTDISRRYLEQLAIMLKNAALVKGFAGRNGGYVLAKPAHQIAIGSIVEATLGPITLSDCVLRPETCVRSTQCPCRKLWVLLNKQIKETLFSFTLADLLSPECLEAITVRIGEHPGGQSCPEQVSQTRH